MKYAFPILFFLLLVGSCDKSDDSGAGLDEEWFRGLVNETYTKKVRDSLLPEAQKRAEDLYTQDGYRWEFIYSFFDGYVYALTNVDGEVTIDIEPNPSQKGFDCGMAYYKKRVETESQNFSFEDFGFELLTAKGTYQWDFEMSDFRPTANNKRWWVHFSKGVLESFAESRDIDEDSIFDEKRMCTFKGYLAPEEEGGVGHFNMYDREFIVVEILEVK